MATERRKMAIAKRLEKTPMNPKQPMGRFEKEVTDWLKQNVPTKKTKFLHSHVVNYFIGRRAVDLLVEESPWSKGGAKAAERLFESREEAVEVLDTLLRYKMFHRARKIPVTEEKERKGSSGGRPKRKGSAGSSSNGDTDQDKEGSGSEKEAGAATLASSPAETADGGEKLAEGSDETSCVPVGDGEAAAKKKRKIRLDMHLEQMFLDCSDAYVWLYDPIPWYYWLAGGGIVLILAAFCLFPLWPRPLRRGAHWVAFLAACFMVGVICLAVVKYLLFVILYGLSGRKFKFWIFPNLTEDVGFLASFWPLYGYTYTGEVVRDVDELEDEEVEGMVVVGGKKTAGEESDSNESGKSGGFEFVDKCKDD